MGKERNRVINTRMGRREVSPESVIHFPHGIIGFDRQREFALIPIKDDSPFLMLQSLSDPALGLLVADPYSFMDKFEAKLGQAEKKILRIKNLRQMAVLVTVSIPKGEPEKTTLNLSGPIVINTEARVGMQVPQVDSDYPAKYRPYEKAAAEDQ